MVGLSALLSFFRGFAREIISLCSWIGASLVTLYTFPTVPAYLAAKSGANPLGYSTFEQFFGEPSFA